MPYKNRSDANARARWRKENEPGHRERVIAQQAGNWRQRMLNPDSRERHRQKTRNWRAANLEKSREFARKSADKQRLLYPEKTNAHARKAQTARMKRYPAWADDEKIQAVYAAAKVMTKMMDEPFHVDHVLPLQGKKVSGLHVHQNLQILPARENHQKHAKFEPE